MDKSNYVRKKVRNIVFKTKTEKESQALLAAVWPKYEPASVVSPSCHLTFHNPSSNMLKQLDVFMFQLHELFQIKQRK